MIITNWWGTNSFLLGTHGAVLSLGCCLFGTLGDPSGVTRIVVFTGTLGSAVSV